MTFRKTAYGLLGCACFLLVASSTLATPPEIKLDDSWRLRINAQYRPRLIIDTNKDFVSGRNNELVTQRARLGFSFHDDDDLEFKIGVQDVRVWGEETSTLNDFDADGFDVNEAYVNIPLYVDELYLKLGRQSFAFDNQRLIGAVNWAQRGRWFDGGKLSWTSFERLTMDVFYAKIREAEDTGDGHVPAAPDDDADVGGVHFSIKPMDFLTLAPLYVFNGDYAAFPGGGDHIRHTLGMFLKGDHGEFGYTAEGFYQFGELEHPTRGHRSVKTYMLAASAQYTPDVRFKPGFKLWGEYLNGNGTPRPPSTLSTQPTTANTESSTFSPISRSILPHSGSWISADVSARNPRRSGAPTSIFITFARARKTLGERPLSAMSWTLKLVSNPSSIWPFGFLWVLYSGGSHAHAKTDC